MPMSWKPWEIYKYITINFSIIIARISISIKIYLGQVRLFKARLDCILFLIQTRINKKYIYYIIERMAYLLIRISAWRYISSIGFAIFSNRIRRMHFIVHTFWIRISSKLLISGLFNGQRYASYIRVYTQYLTVSLNLIFCFLGFYHDFLCIKHIHQ